MKLHFVRSIRGLQNFLAIPIMNPLVGFMIIVSYIHFVEKVSGTNFDHQCQRPYQFYWASNGLNC